MSITVTKLVGTVVLGRPSDGITVTKLVGTVIYDTNTGGTVGSPKVRKKVRVRGQIIYS